MKNVILFLRVKRIPTMRFVSRMIQMINTQAQRLSKTSMRFVPKVVKARMESLGNMTESTRNTARISV